MKELLNAYENKPPEIVFNWKDPETEAEGWTVINFFRGGAAAFYLSQMGAKVVGILDRAGGGRTCPLRTKKSFSAP